jgi:hypothetical protein
MTICQYCKHYIRKIPAGQVSLGVCKKCLKIQLNKLKKMTAKTGEYHAGPLYRNYLPGSRY